MTHKIALIISGPTRGFAHAFPSWKPFINQVADVYYCMVPPAPGEPLIIDLLPDAKGIYVEDIPERQWFVTDKGMDWRAYYPYRPGVIAGFQYESRKRAFEQIKGDYDLVAYVRPDLHFINPLDLSKLDTSRLWTPKYHLWGGLCDRLAVGTPTMMEHYCNLWSHLSDDINAMQVANLEERLAHYLVKSGIPLGWIDTDFYPVAADGTHRTVSPNDYGMYLYPRFGHLAQLEVR